MSRRIMIVDDVATNRIVLKAKLAAACYQPVLAVDGAHALALARTDPPDLILLDYAMPGMNGVQTCLALRADPVTADVPIIVVTAYDDDDARIAALQAGADDFLTKPIDEAVLMARIRNLLRAVDRAGDRRVMDSLGFAEPAAGFTGPPLIGLIAARPEIALRWRNTLAPHLSATIETLAREAVLDGTAPAADLYLVSQDLPAPGGGMQLISDLRARQAGTHAAICLVAPGHAPGVIASALDLGADDVMQEGFDGAEAALRARTLIARKRAADTQRARLRQGLRLAITDPLTGLHNRRYAMSALDRLLGTAQAQGSLCAVMVLDLDRFKAVNDRFGHAAGDTVLSEIARRLSAALRPADLIARIGGEEFMVVAPDIGSKREAGMLAERLRSAVCDHPVSVPGCDGLTVTMSIGLALAPAPCETGSDALARADQALLAAKADGRNQVTFGTRSVA